ncbi:glycine cleavage system aminomethyltransferase GcvT [Sphingomonas hankookensis]|uniref:glycine cleavage system aminomethyltransferase GcvT n=1 Tax=Sphingomonas hankookensis TaxID=563996 RepID=UPI001F59FBAF|nr:glycine cleavage system aminomethyltransferase GcvT [Sphingomonas hankookensis]
MSDIAPEPAHELRADGTDPVEELPPQVLPLDAWHRAQGGRMVPFAGYTMPVQYEGIMAEHLWTRDSAGLFDVSHMGQLVIHGPDTTAALEVLLPGDLRILKPAKMRYSLLLDEQGGILDDLMVTRLDAADPGIPFPMDAAAGDDAFYMVVNGATKYDDIGHLREHLADEITLNHLDDRALLALQGPKAVDALDRIVPGVAALTFMTAGSFAWNGHALWVSRSGYTGEDGYEISLQEDAATAFAEAICAEPEVKPIGLGARDSLRLEAGLPLYGHDLSPDTTPVAADLGFALSKRRREEGGFPGAERILAERAAGPALKRIGVIVDGRQPVREGAEVVDADGSVVGHVTSGGFAPSVQAPIAMAYCPPALAESGAITLRQRGKLHPARVVPMPFVPHRYVR